MGRGWQSKESLEGRAAQKGRIEIRSQNEDRTWTKLSAGQKERQVEVKVEA